MTGCPKCGALTTAIKVALERNGRTVARLVLMDRATDVRYVARESAAVGQCALRRERVRRRHVCAGMRRAG